MTWRSIRQNVALAFRFRRFPKWKIFGYECGFLCVSRGAPVKTIHVPAACLLLHRFKAIFPIHAFEMERCRHLLTVPFPPFHEAVRQLRCAGQNDPCSGGVPASSRFKAIFPVHAFEMERCRHFFYASFSGVPVMPCVSRGALIKVSCRRLLQYFPNPKDGKDNRKSPFPRPSPHHIRYNNGTFRL